MSAEPSRDGVDPGLDDVVVGIDGSSASLVALRWAVEHVGPGGRIRAVHVVAPGEEQLDGALDDLLADLVHATGTLVETVTCEGRVAHELVQLAIASQADAVVVGHHAHEHLGPQLVGHVTAQLLHASELPVVVVPRDWSSERTAGRPVVVGVGVSRGTRSALRWTMDRPRLCAHGLVLAHALGPRSVFRPDGWLDVVAYHLDPSVLSTWFEQDLLDLARRIEHETGADVDVEVSVRRGRTGERLVEAGQGGSVLVIGRGEPPFIRSRTIAPYLRHAIVHAPCPIVVVPAADDD